MGEVTSNFQMRNLKKASGMRMQVQVTVILAMEGRVGGRKAEGKQHEDPQERREIGMMMTLFVMDQIALSMKGKTRGGLNGVTLRHQTVTQTMAVKRKRKEGLKKAGSSQRKHFSVLEEGRGKSRGRIQMSPIMMKSPRRGASPVQRSAAGT